jgi:probable HAF family extracellular repeat protein
MENLGTLGGDYSVAKGINDAGQVVGYSPLSGHSQHHAFLYSDGVMRDLGTLGGFVSRAYAINNSGQVVGWSWPADPEFPYGHAFLYSDGVMQDLGTLGGLSSEARDINNNGQVVGWATLPGDSTCQAFLYSDGVMINLNTFAPAGWHLEEAMAINDLGQIVGWGYNPAGCNEAFLLNLVPEPATLFLFATGGLVLRRKCRN